MVGCRQWNFDKSHAALSDIAVQRQCVKRSTLLSVTDAKKNFLFIFFFISALIWSIRSDGMHLPDNMREQKLAFLANEQHLPIEPRAVISAADGFVIAGKTGMSAWASKTNLQGKILWQYRFDKLPHSAEQPRFPFQAPQFNGIAVSPDGSVWLVGSAYEGNSRMGLVVHLGADGSVISERGVQPKAADMPPIGFSNLVDCHFIGANLIIVGSTQTKTLETNPLQSSTQAVFGSQTNPAFWILTIDVQGNTVDDRVVPTKYDRPLAESKADMTLLLTGNDLIISGKTGADTELLRTDVKGTKTYQRHYPNAHLQFVHPAHDGSELELVGTMLADAREQKVGKPFSAILLSLDAELREVKRQAIPIDVVTNAAFRQQDRSLVLFGAAVHQDSQLYTSQVTHLSPDLSTLQALSLDRVDVQDTGMIYAAERYDSRGRYILVRLAVVAGYPDRPSQLRDAPGFLRGAILEQIDIP